MYWALYVQYQECLCTVLCKVGSWKGRRQPARWLGYKYKASKQLVSVIVLQWPSVATTVAVTTALDLHINSYEGCLNKGNMQAIGLSCTLQGPMA
jgi:hypothetical protein